MKKLSLFFLVFTGLHGLKAQFINNGATITVSAGGYIFCAGNFQNNSGSVTNNGRIEVQGNFQNASTYSTSTNDDSLILSGTANSTLNGGSSPISILYINKATSTAEVKLAGTTTVSQKIGRAHV